MNDAVEDVLARASTAHVGVGSPPSLSRLENDARRGVPSGRGAEGARALGGSEPFVAEALDTDELDAGARHAPESLLVSRARRRHGVLDHHHPLPAIQQAKADCAMQTSVSSPQRTTVSRPCRRTSARIAGEAERSKTGLLCLTDPDTSESTTTGAVSPSSSGSSSVTTIGTPSHSASRHSHRIRSTSSAASRAGRFRRKASWTSIRQRTQWSSRSRPTRRILSCHTARGWAAGSAKEAPASSGREGPAGADRGEGTGSCRSQRHVCSRWQPPRPSRPRDRLKPCDA